MCGYLEDYLGSWNLNYYGANSWGPIEMRANIKDRGNRCEKEGPEIVILCHLRVEGSEVVCLYEGLTSFDVLPLHALP